MKTILLNEVAIKWNNDRLAETPHYTLEHKGPILIILQNALMIRRNKEAEGSCVTLMTGNNIHVAENLETIHRLANAESKND